jgi:hypothetical protein
MAGQLTIDTLRAGSGVLATQNGMTGIAKAWVNFAGASGTIASSFNVSSITRNSTGDYTINFTTAMPNTSYVALGMTGSFGVGNGLIGFYEASTTTRTASLIRIYSTNQTGTGIDGAYQSVAIFSS